MEIAQILLKVLISVCQNAVQCSLRSIPQGSIRWPPLLSMIFQRVFVLQFFFCLLMILNDCRLSIHINQGLNIISLWRCNTNIFYNEAEFSYSCTILAKSFNSPNKTKRCTKKTSVVLLLLIIRNGQSTIAIKSLQEKPNKP